MKNKKRLIVANEIEELFYKQIECGATDLMDAFDFALEDAQTVDAVEVVRCKDCKHSGLYCFGTSHEPSFACLDIDEDGFIRMATVADPNGYCSYGERKGDEEN